ncbi:MAG TPA: helix-turn-helix domain-containing protein [Jatrophihabitans sp.]|nr:helix-turn-helix domain-containing protein [Jatrophihabitans sp.]
MQSQSQVTEMDAVGARGGMTVVGTARAAVVEAPDELTGAMHARRAELSELIAAEIGRHIDDYADQPDLSYSEVVKSAVSQAVGYFIDSIADPRVSRAAVDEWFQRIGRGEAFAGRSLDSLRSAYQLAAGIAWKSLHALALELRLPSSTLGGLGDALFAFMDSLADQSVIGYQDAQAQLSDAAYQWRERLLEAILEPGRQPGREIGQLAATGNWEVPEQVVLIAVERAGDLELPPPRRLHPRVLANLRGPAPVVLHPAPLPAEARSDLAAAFAGHTLAIGCPMPLADAASSLRWARRCLELAASGVIARQPVLEATDHLALLWLHAEPMLRHRLGAAVLEPLYRQPPHSRRILAETMLAWLETRASAPALAVRLGVHAQTVRYRLKRMHEIFGPDLADGQRCFEIYLVLRASMPLWRAGHEPDGLAGRQRRG